MTRRLPLVFLLMLLVIPLASANQIVTTGYFPDAIAEYEQEGMTSMVYTVNSSRAISNVQFRASKGTTINYTITYGTGGALDGYITYLPGDIDVYGYGQGVTTINIGSSTDSRSFIDTGLLRKWEIVGYAREESDNGTVVSTGYAVYDVSLGIGNIGFQSGFIAYEPVASLQPIESISFTADQPVWIFIGTADRDQIQSGISKTALDIVNEWVAFAVSMGTFVLDLVIALFYWLKFFFVDNLVMTVALYISITMAYAACTSKNIFHFFRKFLNDQRKLFEFLLGLWTTLINILGTFRGIFRI